ncbi:MAG: acyl-CoA dehydrogenase family protein [Acidimicrobiales bacterium]
MPTQEAVRSEVLARIDGIAEALADEVGAAESAGRLPDSTVELLRSARLLWLKVPAELGGFEAEPALQIEVFERLALANPSAAWCTFIYADTAGMATSRLGDEGLARYLDGGDVAPTAGGGGLRPGKLRRVDGGYRLTGRFRYGSGITGATWVHLAGVLAEEDGGRMTMRQCLVRKDDLRLDDNWDVLGMRGTGSIDFAADDVFVPAELTYEAQCAPLRGGRQYRTGVAGYLGYTIPAVAAGAARRALDEVVAGAAGSVRGYRSPKPLADNPAFHRFVGEADQKLKAAKALMMANGERLMEAVDRQGGTTDAQEVEVRAAAALATNLALEVITGLVPLAGGSGMRTGSLVEQALRDIAVMTTHYVVAGSAIEHYGRALLGLPADPLG